MTNTITIQGRLAADPELRFGKSGTAFCNVSVPDQKRKKNERGEWEDASATTWFRVTVFGDEAEALAESGRKGDQVVVTGRLITREWQKDDGSTGSALEVDYAKVALVPGGRPNTQRQQGQAGGWGGAQQPASDPWGQQGGAYGEPTF